MCNDLFVLQLWLVSNSSGTMLYSIGYLNNLHRYFSMTGYLLQSVVK